MFTCATKCALLAEGRSRRRLPTTSEPRLGRRRLDLIVALARREVGLSVAIDQGGCFETSRPTTHADPTYVVDGVVHYCVTNMPGAVPRTSTFALTNATLPYVKALADHGIDAALSMDSYLASGLNVRAGAIAHEAVARDLGMTFRPFRPMDAHAA